MSTSVKPRCAIFLDIDGVVSRWRQDDATDEKILQLRKLLWDSDPFYSDSTCHTPTELYNLSLAKAAALSFDSEAIDHLKSLIDRINDTMEPIIVLISSWRQAGNVADLKNHVFALRDWLADKIVDKTPDDKRFYAMRRKGILRSPQEHTPDEQSLEEIADIRGRQIAYWLEKNGKAQDVQSYVILDDVCQDWTEIPKLHPGCFVQVDAKQLLTAADVEQACAIAKIPFNSEQTSSLDSFEEIPL